MLIARLEVRNPTGLHMRPATEFAQIAQDFSCAVRVRKGDKSANAKSLLKLLTIGVSQGDVIELSCNGADEAEALARLSNFLENLCE